MRKPHRFTRPTGTNSQRFVTAQSYKDPAIQNDLITLTLMDVVHGINLDTSHSMADIEQGDTAIFSSPSPTPVTFTTPSSSGTPTASRVNRNGSYRLGGK